MSAVLHEFQSSGDGLDHLLQLNGPHYSIQFRSDLTVSFHLFPFPAIQHSHRDACCQQQHRCLSAVHNQQQFSGMQVFLRLEQMKIELGIFQIAMFHLSYCYLRAANLSDQAMGRHRADCWVTNKIDHHCHVSLNQAKLFCAYRIGKVQNKKGT